MPRWYTPGYLGGDIARVYDRLAADYHLIFADWEASVARQAAALGDLIASRQPAASTVLDLACGIGTQSLGLADMRRAHEHPHMLTTSRAHRMIDFGCRGTLGI